MTDEQAPHGPTPVAGEDDRRVFQPHVGRNREPILEVLRPRTRGARRLLEIGSGTGEHAWFFARNLDHLRWMPTEASAEKAHRADAFRQFEPLPNLDPVRVLDATADDWGLQEDEHPDVVYCANVIHIAPYAVCEGIVRGAARLVGPSGRLMLYGPFMVDGEHTAPSNAAFSERLRERDPQWGVRAIERVQATATEHGFALTERVAMPANNFVACFERG